MMLHEPTTVLTDQPDLKLSITWIIQSVAINVTVSRNCLVIKERKHRTLLRKFLIQVNKYIII